MSIVRGMYISAVQIKNVYLHHECYVLTPGGCKLNTYIIDSCTSTKGVYLLTPRTSNVLQNSFRSLCYQQCIIHKEEVRKVLENLTVIDLHLGFAILNLTNGEHFF